MIKSTGTNIHSKLLLFTIMVLFGLLVSACGTPVSEVQPTAVTSATT